MVKVTARDAGSQPSRGFAGSLNCTALPCLARSMFKNAFEEQTRMWRCILKCVY